MARAETNISNQIRAAASKMGQRLFRNSRGMFWTMDKQRKTRAGLEAPGASDLIGWTQIEITPEMVGKTIAVFTAVEVKTARGSVSDDQQHFIDVVQRAGGIAGVARSEEDAGQIREDSARRMGSLL